jgi:peptide/nickel transport system permease protein
MLGLDRSIPVQIAKYFRGIFSGDWGVSIHTKQPVLSDLGIRAPASLELVGAAILLALIVGIPLGLVAARWRGHVPDVGVRLLSVAGVSMPVFWLGLILQLVFFQRLHWLPVSGEYDPGVEAAHPLHLHTHMPVVDALVEGNWPVLGSSLSHLVLPAAVVASYPLGVIARMVRASVLETLGEDHVRAARARGLPERRVLLVHGLKAAALPLVTLIGLQAGFVLAGSYVVEFIFNWPGIGKLTLDAVNSRNFPMIQGGVLVAATGFVLVNFVVDVAYSLLDPRIRRGAR